MSGSSSAASSRSSNGKKAEKNKASILISFRLEGKHLGKGAFYDHYTLQRHTAHESAVVHSSDKAIKTKYLAEYINSQTVNMPHSPIDATVGRPVPITLDPHTEGGLLVIPGMTRDSYEKSPTAHQIRIEFERGLLKDALRRGRPILAICAGSWTLWEALGGTLKVVSDHNYGGGMPRISAQGKMSYNKHVHDVEVTQGTLLGDAMALGDTQEERTLPANSIHWLAPDDTVVPPNFEIAAKSKRNAEVSIQTRQATQMAPQEDSVEGFCSKFGAPVAGFVWHLEAFDWDSRDAAAIANNNALLFMAKAGDAYQEKQTMLREFKEVASAVDDDRLDGLHEVFGKMKI